MLFAKFVRITPFHNSCKLMAIYLDIYYLGLIRCPILLLGGVDNGHGTILMFFIQDRNYTLSTDGWGRQTLTCPINKRRTINTSSWKWATLMKGDSVWWLSLFNLNKDRGGRRALVSHDVLTKTDIFFLKFPVITFTATQT